MGDESQRWTVLSGPVRHSPSRRAWQPWWWVRCPGCGRGQGVGREEITGLAPIRCDCGASTTEPLLTPLAAAAAIEQLRAR